MRASGTKSAKRILVIQLADLGDLVLAAPAIRQLRRSHPGAHLSLLTKPTNRELADQLADDVIVADKQLYDSVIRSLRPSAMASVVRLVAGLRQRRFDEVLVMHHLVTRWGTLKFMALTLAVGAPVRRGLDNGRGWFLNRRVRDRGFGAADEQAYWTEMAGGADPFGFQGLESSCVAQPDHDYAVIHPGSGNYSTARRWPADHFRVVMDGLWRQHGLASVLVGGAEEQKLCSEIIANPPPHALDLSGETDLNALAGLLRRASLFVGNDGGVAQVAQAVGTPSVVIFGPTSPKTWMNRSSHARAVRIDLACSPCMYHHFQLGTPPGCETRECLLLLSPDLVLREVKQILEPVHA